MQVETKHSWFNVNPIFLTSLSIVDGALITYYDHLDRTSLLPLSQQGSTTSTPTSDDEIMFAVIRLTTSSP